MDTISIDEINDHVPELITKIQTGEIISVTLKGLEIAKLVPPDYSFRVARKRLEALRKTAVIGDILSPINEKWDAAE